MKARIIMSNIFQYEYGMLRNLNKLLVVIGLSCWAGALMIPFNLLVCIPITNHICFPMFAEFYLMWAIPVFLVILGFVLLILALKGYSMISFEKEN